MKLNDLLKESFNAADSELNDDMQLLQYRDWDSMSFMYFITRLEEGYEVELTGDEISQMNTVGDVKNLITSKGKQL